MALTDDVYIPKLKVDSDGGFSIQNLNDIIRRIFTKLYALEGRTEESTIRNNAIILGSLTLDGVSNPGVSVEDDAKIYFDTTLRKLRVSENGGAFADLVPVSVVINGTTNEITVSGGSGTFTIGLPDNVALGLAAPITTATDGFPYVPAMAGNPTGTPTSITGFRPMVLDDANATLFHRSSAEWLGIYDRTVLSPAQITSDQNNYNPGYGYVWRLDTDAARTITGIAGHNSVGGRRIHIINIGANTVILAHQNAGSLASNRMICPGAANLTLSNAQSAYLVYDADTSRWRVFSL